MALLAKIKSGTVADNFKPADVYLKGWSHLSNPESVKQAVQLLCDLGHLRREVQLPGTAGGRTSTTYRIHPKIIGGV